MRQRGCGVQNKSHKFVCLAALWDGSTQPLTAAARGTRLDLAITWLDRNSGSTMVWWLVVQGQATVFSLSYQ